MMLSVPKPLASLSSGLLARKGQARPAMRRQMTLAQAGDDLGWNDMGEPLPADGEVAEVAVPAPRPPVLAQRDELSQTLDAPLEAPLPDPGVALAQAAVHGRRAAFTLRLDAERHLRLRLASATRHLSAQRLVTEALDAFLKTMPEVEALAAQLPEAHTDRLGDLR